MINRLKKKKNDLVLKIQSNNILGKLKYINQNFSPFFETPYVIIGNVNYDVID